MIGGYTIVRREPSCPSAVGPGPTAIPYYKEGAQLPNYS